jgi:dTDP-4-dehydrorhamnose reductase
MLSAIMRVLITGLRGTLAPELATTATAQGATVLSWDRSTVSVDDPAVVTEFLQHHQPQAIFHLAMGNEQWAASLAAYAKAAAIPMVFTSTAMVFHHLPNGPHYPNDQRTAQDDYGRYKIHCEDAIIKANPGAIIARIGYQIHLTRHGNNMLSHLQAQHQQHGVIRASTTWVPATSFMPDTADALWKLMQAQRSGVYHLDSNAHTAYSYYQVVLGLQQHLGIPDWRVIATEDYEHDQRLCDTEVNINPLVERLSGYTVTGSR